ncbi:MAG: hypothetical protein ABIZ70_15675 [Gemmatimonadales bacterium]
MNTVHLSMEQLVAVRDSDRSEPAYAEGHRHIAVCVQCAAELERLHQRTARLRALPTLSPAQNQYPAVRTRVLWDRKQTRLRRIAGLTLAAAAMLVVTVIGRDLLTPTRLDAEQQIASAMTSSQQLERALVRINPDERVIDGRTAQLVIQLEDRIADLDDQLAQAATLQREARLRRMVALWQERVGLMNALVDVHVTKASNVDL